MYNKVILLISDISDEHYEKDIKTVYMDNTLDIFTHRIFSALNYRFILDISDIPIIYHVYTYHSL